MFEVDPPPLPIIKPEDSPDWNKVGGLHKTEVEQESVQSSDAPPSLQEKFKHLKAATRRVINAKKNGESVRLPRRIRKQRLAICKNCPGGYWRPNGNFFLGECTHPKCGCTRLKHGLSTEKCEAGYWPDL